MKPSEVVVTKLEDVGNSTFRAVGLGEDERIAKHIFASVCMTFPLVDHHEPKLVLSEKDASKYRYRDEYACFISEHAKQYTTTIRELVTTVSAVHEGIEIMKKIAREDEETSYEAGLVKEKKRLAAADKRAVKRSLAKANQYRDDTGRPL
jgi:hypothetical protein